MRHDLERRFATAVLLVALGRPVLAQVPPVFGADVKLVAVPVFVTDKSGRAVAGLTQGDFEIEDQGKKVAITAFLAVDSAGAAPATESSALLEASARRQFLLLFDLTFSTPTGIMRARDAAIALVREGLTPSDLAAVAIFGPRGVQVLVGFTPDRAQLERAITTLGLVETEPRMRDVLNIAYDLGVPRWGPGIGLPPPEGTMTQYLLMARAEQAVYQQRVDGFLEGMGQLVRTLDSVSGRKQIVLLSAGFDSSVAGGARGQESRDASEAVVSGRLWEVQTDRYFGDSRARDALDALFKTVALTDTVIHTVDLTGISAGGGVAEAFPQPLGPGRDTLAQLAADTGGRFVADANDLRAGLVSLLDSTSHYYVLAFEPLDASARPGRPRKLKVRVRGDGLSVSHRRGYAIADPKAETSPATAVLQAAEAIAKGLTGGALKLRALAVPYRSAAGRLALPVILHVDGRALVAGSSAKQLGLEVYGYAFDGAGRVYDAMTLTPAVDLGAVRGTFETTGLQVITSFSVRKGPLDLRFLVRDKATRRAGSFRLRLEMPGFDDQSVVLSPPLAMDDPRTRLVIPAASRLLPQLEIPFRVGDRAFTAEPLPKLVNGATRELCVLVWSSTGGDGVSGKIEARLVDAAGRERSLELAEPPHAVADADGTLRYVFKLSPHDVPKGRYRLCLDYRDSTRRSGSSELDVVFE